MNELFKEYLFTDLIIELTKNNLDKSLILSELKKRLKFCEFDDKTIEAIIELEQLIVKKRNLNFEKKFVDTFWWLKNRNDFSNSKRMFNKDISEYFLRYNEYFKQTEKIPDNLLTFGELISLMDESTFILFPTMLFQPFICKQYICLIFIKSITQIGNIFWKF